MTAAVSLRTAHQAQQELSKLECVLLAVLVFVVVCGLIYGVERYLDAVERANDRRGDR